MQERGLKEWIAFWANLIISISYAMNHDLPDHKIGAIVWLLMATVWFLSHIAKVNQK